jgi:hypothetical protein
MVGQYPWWNDQIWLILVQSLFSECLTPGNMQAINWSGFYEIEVVGLSFFVFAYTKSA